MADPMIKLVKDVCDRMDADILTFFDDIERPHDDRLIDQCRKRRRRKNLILMLTTRGGDPNAAFRIARCLQMVYSPQPASGRYRPKDDDKPYFAVFVNSICKSAGTLIALGADKIFMTGNAELGPLDIQLRKPDEVGERTSGLTPSQAVQHLQRQAIDLFKAHFTRLRFDADLVFSTKMAAEIATSLTTGLLSPIYSQIDPIRLAEVNRSLMISSEYATRLNRNLKEEALEKLIADYPSHGFVIDREEAKRIFQVVERPPDDLFEIGEFFKFFSREYLEKGEGFVTFLNDRVEGQAQEADDEPSNYNGKGDDNPGETGAEVREVLPNGGRSHPAKRRQSKSGGAASPVSEGRPAAGDEIEIDR